MKTVLVTGANRGIGLELARGYADDGDRVIAICRHPENANELQDIASAAEGRLSVHAADVSDFTRIDALAQEIGDAAIDILINNAGIYGPRRQNATDMDFDGWAHTFAVNTMAPLKMTQAFRPHLEKGAEKKVVIISSQMGSIERGGGGYYAYRTTKAAANRLAKCLASDLAGSGLITVTMHPGWVRTDMGGPSAPVQPADSAAGIRRVIAGLGKDDSGRFLQYDGTELPW